MAKTKANITWQSQAGAMSSRAPARFFSLAINIIQIVTCFNVIQYIKPSINVIQYI